MTEKLQLNPNAPRQSARSTPFGVYSRPSDGGGFSIEIIAAALTVVWLLGSLIFFMVLQSDESSDSGAGLRVLMTMLAVVMPVGMIWVAAIAARSSRVMREESKRLQTAIDAIRQAYISQQQGQSPGADATVARKLDEIAAAARKTESTLATFQSRRDATTRLAPLKPVVVDDQPVLALGTSAADMTQPLSHEDFIRALNFPETADDTEGFSALRKALKDRNASQLVQASQDVLTLLSQDGIYMDDLAPDRARPEIWRQFAQGARGRPIAALGGIRDRSSLALTSARMKQDPIFRDVAHHFLRRFDRAFAAFEAEASDADISALTDTRTVRAFMLLGRVAGTFD
ncbi:MAG: hypothetical protein ACKVLA_05540 [Rhodobacterales bacterium]